MVASNLSFVEVWHLWHYNAIGCLALANLTKTAQFLLSKPTF